MSNEVEFVDNSKGVIIQIKTNVSATEMALGLNSVENTNKLIEVVEKYD